jgi:hypothetical protein
VASKLRKSLILFPFLICIYPILALIAHNAAEMNLVDGLRAIIISFALTLVLYLILQIIIKSPIKTALITTLALIFFYSYGHVNFLIRNWTIIDFSLGRHRVLVPLYSIIFIIAVLLIMRTKRDLSILTRFLNAIGVILLIFPLYQITVYQVEKYLAESNPENTNTFISLPNDQTPPDVYYILADGYPRNDFIVNILDYDNKEFLETLESMGFYVAWCSQTNYTDTRFSMASTLNMSYLDDGAGIPEVVYPGSKLDSMIRSGSVQKNFADLGYTIVTFESGYKWLRWEGSDIHLDPAIERAKRFFITFAINEFEHLLLNTTAAKLVLDMPFVVNPAEANKLAEILNNPRASHRDRVFYTLDKLPEIPETIRGPKFIYAHIIFPHPPFIVDANGRSLKNTPANELSAYAGQIAYLDSMLLEIVGTLLNNSDPEPIIIIQGDHGATIDYKSEGLDKSHRLGILNAYYLPSPPDGNPMDELYPTITPVNTFRLIFDRYFNGQYGQLEDKSIVGRQSPFTTLDCTWPE